MDRAKYEVEVLIETSDDSAQSNIQELSDLELALVGGGSGDTILH